MSTRERPPQWPYHVGLFILCAFLASAIMIFRVNAHKATVTATPQTPKPPTPIVVPTVRSSDLQVVLSENEMYCKEEGKVDYSIFQLTPSGGSLPYKVAINNSLFEELSSFYIYKQNNPFSIQVYGGETIVVKIWSAGSTEPDWESAITIQVADPYCAHAPTLTLTSLPMFPTTSTLTSTITPTVRSITNYPTRTKRPNPYVILTSTPLPVEASSPTVTSTLNPKATATNIPPQTSTSVSTPTKGSGPTSTSAPTASKIPEPTNTRFVPTATSQPQPVITNTVIVIPRLKDCEDGIDNDGDELIDFPNDPQCSDKSDNREDK